MASYWSDVVPGYSLNDRGEQNLKRWLKRFSVDQIARAMADTATQCLDIGADGKATKESVEEAVAKIPSFCIVGSADPDTRQLYHIRGILRNRLPYYCNEAEALRLLKVARSWGAPIAELREIALSSRSWTDFRNRISDTIEEWMKQSGDNE